MMINDLLDKSKPMWFSFDELFAVADLHVSRIRQHDPVDYELLLVRFFDRDGFPIVDGEDGPAVLKMARLSADNDYKIVQQDLLPDGSLLSTVWLGIDHGFGGCPLIFETMRFSGTEETMDFGHGERKYNPSIEFPDPLHPGERTEQIRYMTLEEAHAVHNGILRLIPKEEYQ